MLNNHRTVLQKASNINLFYQIPKNLCIEQGFQIYFLTITLQDVYANVLILPETQLNISLQKTIIGTEIADPFLFPSFSFGRFS